MKSATGFLGGGIGYRRIYREALLGAGPHPDLLEVMPEHFLAAPEELDALGARYPLYFHSVGLSIGTAVTDPLGDAFTRSQLESLRGLAARARPLFVSDHLAFTRGPGGVDLGHLCPLPCTEEVLALLTDRVRAWQDALGLPVAIENIAHPFQWPDTGMSEPELLGRLVEATGCGILLDLTNLLYDGQNFGFDAAAAVATYPLEAVWGVHLAGGVVHARDRFWSDTHDHPVDEGAYALLPLLRGRAPLRAIVVERDRRLPALGELVAEGRRAAEVFRG